MTTLLVPSTISSSLSRISCRALCVATTAGTSRLRATIAVCEVTPPTSVRNAAVAVLLELDHVGRREVVRDQDRVLLGDRRGRRRPACPGAASARARRPERRPPCARAGRDRRSASNCSTSTPICWISAHSALQRCSAMIFFGASDSVGSVRIIQWTSRNAPNSAGASPPVIAECRPSSSRCTSRSALSKRAISAVDRVCGDGVVRDLERRVRDELRPADGDAARDADPVQREARHRPALARTAVDAPSRVRRPLILLRRSRYQAGGRGTRDRRAGAPSSLGDVSKRERVRRPPARRSELSRQCRGRTGEPLALIVLRRSSRGSGRRSRPSPRPRRVRRSRASLSPPCPPPASSRP